MTEITLKTAKFTVKALQLNESLYELRRPPGLPTMQVLFFHGFQQKQNYENAHLFTWTSGDASGLWPQTWLVEKFPNAHILSVSYCEGKLRDILEEYQNRVDLDMYILVENLIADLLHAGIGQEPRCPVVLVGHSFGGLIVKKLIVEIFDKLGPDSRNEEEPRTVQLLNFVDNLKGLFFYATPHHGIEDKSIELLDPALLIPTGPLLDYVKILSKNTARLNGAFDQHLKQQKWRIAGLGESLPSNWGRWSEGRVIVPEGSSRYSVTFNMAVGEDHISISRPKSKTNRSFTAVESLLRDIGDDPQLFGRLENWQDVPQSIVGIEDVLKEVKLKLEKTTKLGFVGMGGVGKTTLAMSLFNDMEKSFRYTCFIRDVKNLHGPKDTKIEDAMLKRLHYGGRKMKEEPRGLNFLRGTRLLLVLDDVSLEEDLQIVRVLCDLPVHKDSRFIATCRDPDPPEKSSHELYGVGLLSPESAKELFLSHAFSNGSIPPALESYVRDVVKKCDRLPLTLVVIGNHLRGKREAIWKEAVDVLDKAKNVNGFYGKLWAILKLSFNGLESKEEKDVFLDAATVFYKSELSKAKVAWRITTDGVEEWVWDRLVQLSLVWEVKEMGKVTIGMHEQIWSLGKMLASTPLESGCSRRIWYDSEEALSLLSTYNNDMDGLKDISALRCCKGQLEMYKKGMTSTSENPIGISERKLQKMTNLQYLWLEGIDVDQTHGMQLAPSVVNLHLSSVNFSGFTFNPHGYYRMNILQIAGCPSLLELPDTFVQFQGLEHIDLLDTSLQSISDLGKLRSLKSVRLNWVPTANFPCLPDCLKGLITKRNFPGPYDLEAHNGKLERKVRVVRQVNESLFELDCPYNTPKIQVVLFHGFQREEYSDAHLSTWQSEDGSTVWPKTWLAEEISGAQVLSVYYSGSLRQMDSDGMMDMDLTRENLLSDLLRCGVGQVPNCPVVLVGHSVGGLVIKDLCCLAHKKFYRSQGRGRDMLERFLKNIGGIFYYSTPPHGRGFAEILAKQISSPVLAFFERLSNYGERLDNDFEHICKFYYKDWLFAGLGAALPTNLGPLRAGFAPKTDLVLPEASSRMVDLNVAEEVDYFSVCRPRSKTARSFTKLRDFVSQIAIMASNADLARN